MNLLEKVKKIRGAESAIGMTFGGAALDSGLPVGSRLIGYTNSVYFCFVEGYLDTVFAVDPEHEPYATPLAYNFADFLRLLLACGSAQVAAAAAYDNQDAFRAVFSAEQRYPHTDLQTIATSLGLKALSNPYDYARNVRRVIDCSRIVRR